MRSPYDERTGEAKRSLSHASRTRASYSDPVGDGVAKRLGLQRALVAWVAALRNSAVADANGRG